LLAFAFPWVERDIFSWGGPWVIKHVTDGKLSY